MPLFSNEDLKCLDSGYFFIIIADVYDVVVMSMNTNRLLVSVQPRVSGKENCDYLS